MTDEQLLRAIRSSLELRGRICLTHEVTLKDGTVEERPTVVARTFVRVVLAELQKQAK